MTATRPATSPRKQLGRREFTALLAMSMALSALGIDLMLPAFPAMRRELGLAADSTAVAGLVTAYFLGLALGQLGYGPLADRYGRRATLYLGYGVYAVGAVAATLSPTLPLLLASRFVWGLGAAGPRVVTLAVIRDTFEGEQMSRAMSFIMAVFIVVPVFAPTLGAAVAAAVSWRWLFAGCAAAAVVMAVWAVRLPETLRPEHRRPLRFSPVLRAARVVVSDRRTVGYTLAMASLYGVFASYLGGAEIIFGDTFGQTANFPVLFGGLAAVMGAAMLVNARLVGRVGTRQLTHWVLVGYTAAATALFVLSLATGGRPPLAVFVMMMAILLSLQALLIPNFNTIAMAPMGRLAGTASSVIGAVQLSAGAVLGSLLDRAFDGTVLPLSVGAMSYAGVALGFVLWAERGRLFRPLTTAPAVPEQAGPAVAAEA
ncbi:MAG: multidrug effflux MFS transporter [Euzebyales bacterium]|nr:multidrug effflux MFS transporter [Euzebyales bacterium]MDQ3342336.1 multidrug effflux MFS transporter [Actinomycetota bacterium]